MVGDVNDLLLNLRNLASVRFFTVLAAKKDSQWYALTKRIETVSDCRRVLCSNWSNSTVVLHCWLMFGVAISPMLAGFFVP